MDKRVKFDFDIEFTNGGDLHGHDFRLDIAGETISDEELANYLVRDLRLLMVGQVRILNKTILAEPHKRAVTRPTTLIDLSHTIEDGLVTYKGLPAPIICDYLSREQSRAIYAPGVEFQIGKIEMVANTGTYLDCPFHRYADGQDLAQIAAERLTDLDGVVIRVDHRQTRAIEADHFKGHDLRGRAVLVSTGWDAHWKTDQYFEAPPYLTAEAARYLQTGGASLVGIDSMNIDHLEDKTRPVHSTLLKSGILIVEHLCHLDQLPTEGFTFSAVPPKFQGVGTFPVRALAKLA